MNPDELLAKPTAPTTSRRQSKVAQRSIEIQGDTATVEIPDCPDAEGTALRFLQDENLNPDEWTVNSFRKIEYGQGMTSVRFSFLRTGKRVSATLTDGELELVLASHPPRCVAPAGSQGPSRTYLVALGDMQFGKDDGDGIAGTIVRTMRTLDKAYELYFWYAERFDINEIVVGFLGDHIEGFSSQGGANAWRTHTPLTEQIRVTRRIMLYAMQLFAHLGLPLKMVAVPGNHGEAVRFDGGGITRYDDSHDTECLIAVADAAKLNPESFDHVQFFVPQTDEMSVALNLNNTNVVFNHGSKMKPGKYHEWVKGQAYNRNSLFRDCDVVLMGHYHHEYVEASSDRMILQVPTLEGGSTWYKHQAGDEAQQGILVGLVGEGRVDNIEYVR